MRLEFEQKEIKSPSNMVWIIGRSDGEITVKGWRNLMASIGRLTERACTAGPFRLKASRFCTSILQGTPACCGSAVEALKLGAFPPRTAGISPSAAMPATATCGCWKDSDAERCHRSGLS